MRRRRRKNRMMPVIVVTALIAVIGVAGVISFLVGRYRPGTEWMDGREYFSLTSDEEAALILNDTVREEKAVLIQGEPYVSYSFAQSELNRCLYWDQDTASVLITTAEGVRALSPEDPSAVTSSGQPAVRTDESGGVLIALETVSGCTDMEYEFLEDPARAVLRTDFAQRMEVTAVAEVCRVRYRGGIKSDILTEVPQGERMTLLDEMEEWSQVATADGYIGYVQKKDLSAAEPLEGRESSDPALFDRIARDHKINLVWHQTTSQSANAALSEAIAQMSGVNVISPTWFSVTDNQGTVSSLGSAEYVQTAHAAGLEVWGLVDNFSGDFDTASALASSQVRSRIIDQLLSEARAYGLDGINVDFERLKEEGIPHFLQFLRELTARAHEDGLVVSADTPVPQSFSAYYDRAEQARCLDYIIMMGYDEHYAGDDEAGSVASLPFVTEGIREMVEEISPERVILAVPFYTRVWTEVFGQTAVTSEVLGMNGADQYVSEMGMSVSWDGAVGQNVAMLETDTARYTIWMEDEQSIGEKLKLIPEYGLGGVAEWKLGFERASIWPVISGYLN